MCTDEPLNLGGSEERLGRMFCWHPRYVLGDEQFHRGSHVDERVNGSGDLAWPWSSLENVREWLVCRRGASVVLPLFLYEHGGLWVSIDRPLDPGGWDTTRIGFIYCAEQEESLAAPGIVDIEGTRTEEDLTERLRREVDQYSRSLRGW